MFEKAAQFIWQGAIRWAEAKLGPRYPTMNKIFAVHLLLLLATMPICLVGHVATGQARVDGWLGYYLMACLIVIWIGCLALLASYSRETHK